VTPGRSPPTLARGLEIWMSVRELRVTGNAVERTAILAGGSPTHFSDDALFPPVRRAI